MDMTEAKTTSPDTPGDINRAGLFFRGLIFTVLAGIAAALVFVLLGYLPSRLAEGHQGLARGLKAAGLIFGALCVPAGVALVIKTRPKEPLRAVPYLLGVCVGLALVLGGLTLLMWLS